MWFLIPIGIGGIYLYERIFLPKAYGATSPATAPKPVMGVQGLPLLDVVFNSIKSIVGTGALVTNAIEKAAYAEAKSKLIISEGDRNDVYKDSEGKLTVGIGHLVLPSDNLKLGDIITDARKKAFFEADIAKAFTAAKAQARELAKYTPSMIAALTEVNFQLGTGWKYTFANTWNYLKKGSWKTAVNNLKVSKWNSQTPVRVANFINAIQENYAA